MLSALSWHLPPACLPHCLPRPLAVAPLKHGKSFQLPGGSCCSCCCCCRCRVNCCPFEPGQNVQYFWHFSLVVVRATMILNHVDAVEGEEGSYKREKTWKAFFRLDYCTNYARQGAARSSWLCSLPQIFVLIFPFNPHSHTYIHACYSHATRMLPHNKY